MSEQTPASAATPTPDDPKKRLREKVDKLLAAEPRKSESSIKQNGRTLKYTAIAQFVPISASGVDDKRGEPEAAVFTTSYFLKDADPKTRPVCFVFNGGPGSASIWLHLGALGPKRVVIREDGTMPPPPYAVTDNQESWFEHFDLVFIDPPHTGYSITASEDARKKMLSVDGDVDALAECMRTWLGRHRRWSSQVYLVGESYGTTRGAALADKLQNIGVALSGLILVSCAMDLQSIVFSPRNDLPYALFLPAFACVAHRPDAVRQDVADECHGQMEIRRRRCTAARRPGKRNRECGKRRARRFVGPEREEHSLRRGAMFATLQHRRSRRLHRPSLGQRRVRGKQRAMVDRRAHYRNTPVRARGRA
jgi:carboxypeptidase C (cathepsin A)